MITNSSVILLNKEIDATDFNNEKVMMDMEKGKYFSLNEVGSRIWDLIEGEVEVQTIINKMLEEYEIDEKVCENHVISYLGALYEAELISVK